MDVYLDGTKSVNHVIKEAEALGCTITARVDWYHQGALSMYLPLDQAAKLAKVEGVDSARLSLKPRHWVGKATSQGTTVLKSATVNAAGYRGANITVGALSDSFDTAKLSTTPELTNATQDEADDDLPGPGSVYNTKPVYVLEDYGNTAATAGTDEGRAMCQIIHDVAPAANIAFATADVSEVGFAQNILALATPTTQTVTIPASKYTVPAAATGATTVTVNGGGCQVICDDVGYTDEAMFSDGVVAQAIDKATATYGTSYFSSAGNDGNSGYSATYNPQPNNATNQALLLSQGGITYTGIGTGTTETGVIESFHSFGTDANGNPILVQKVLVPTLNTLTAYGGYISFQWDDPDGVTVNGVKQVTTDFDILTFSVNATTGVATYQSRMSGVGSNFSTNVPVEDPSRALTPGTQYEFVIVRTNRTPTTGITANQATHIRWAVDSDASTVVADFITPNSPNSYGHPNASTCNGTAAYVYDKGFSYLDSPYVPEIENYSSNGAATIYFDSAGNRLSSPVIRKQPTLATVDGIDTSFFGGSTTDPTAGDSDGDNLPNFFGTSAAAPHGAGCAALLLNAAAVNGITLAPADIRSLLTSTTQGSQDQDPAYASGTASPVKFSTIGRGTYSDPDAYTVAFSGATGAKLTSLVFDLTSINDQFYTGTYPITFGGATAPTGTAPTIASSALSNAASGSTTNGFTETLTFNNFNVGDTLSFGVCTVSLTAGVYEFGGDDLAGATFTATVTNTDATTSTYTGTLANTFGRKWNVKSGYGLVDVNAAVNRLLGH